MHLDARVRARVFLRQTASDNVELGLRLRHRRARSKPSQHVDEARLPVLHPRGGVLAERRADIHASRELESFRCDADDGVRLSVEDEPLADGVEPAAEAALPQASG